MVGWLTRAWRRYWFGREGRLSIEVVRIALALGVLLTWKRVAASDYEQLFAVMPADSYHPAGVLRLFGSVPPPGWFLEVCKVVGLVAGITMLVGLASRVSTVVSLLAMLFLAGTPDSFSATWHHSFTPLLAAHLVFAFARCGRALSVDAALRRWRTSRRPDAEEAANLAGGTEGPKARADVKAAETRVGHVPAWPALLVQMVSSLPYLSAAIAKIAAGRGLGWVLSDSLRHHILARFDWNDHGRTALADLIVRNEALWKAAALGNLVSQMLPFAACFFVRRPLVRLVLGSFFIVETISLDLVMDLPNYHWLPLAAAFVDWDWLVASIRQRWRGAGEAVAVPAELSPEVPAPRRRLATVVIIGLLALNMSITLGPTGLDRRLNTYPVSQYKMFSRVRAKRPYTVHQTWEFDILRFAVEGTRKGGARAAGVLDKRFRGFRRTRSASQVERILRQAARRVAKVKPRSLALWYSILQAPAYPSGPDLVSHGIGMLGRLRRDTFQSLLGRAVTEPDGTCYLEPRAVGMALPADLRVSYILGLDPRLRPLAVERRVDRLYYRPPESGRYLFVAGIGDEQFIIAEAKHRVAQPRNGAGAGPEQEEDPESGTKDGSELD